CFFFQAEDGIRDFHVTGVQTCALPISRLMLSGKGLPTSGSVGYEIFDESNVLGQTDFVQQLNRQRALEGELARTIRSLDGVTFRSEERRVGKRVWSAGVGGSRAKIPK